MFTEGREIDRRVEIHRGNEMGGGGRVHGLSTACEARGGRGEGQPYMGGATPMAQPLRVEGRHC